MFKTSHSLIITAFWIITVVAAPAPLFAEPSLEQAFEQQRQNCMGNETRKNNPDRAAYCDCVSDGMRRWDEATLARVAKAQQGNDRSLAGPIAELAQDCLSKVFQIVP